MIPQPTNDIQWGAMEKGSSLGVAGLCSGNLVQSAVINPGAGREKMEEHSDLCCRLFIGIFHVSSGSYFEAGLGLISGFSLHTRFTETTTAVI